MRTRETMMNYIPFLVSHKIVSHTNINTMVTIDNKPLIVDWIDCVCNDASIHTRHFMTSAELHELYKCTKGIMMG